MISTYRKISVLEREEASSGDPELVLSQTVAVLLVHLTSGGGGGLLRSGRHLGLA